MTSFSPARARSWSLRSVVRVGLFCALMIGRSSDVEELAAAAHLGDARDEEVQVLGHLNKVEPLAVDHQERAVGVVQEVASVGLRQAPQVLLGDWCLDGI